MSFLYNWQNYNMPQTTAVTLFRCVCVTGLRCHYLCTHANITEVQSSSHNHGFLHSIVFTNNLSLTSFEIYS